MLMLTISNALIARGHDVLHVCTPHTWLADATQRAGITRVLLCMKKYIDIVSIVKLGLLFRRYKPDVVHIYFISDMWLVVPAVRLFYPQCKLFLLRSMQSSPMKDMMRTKLLGSFDKIFVMSDFLRSDFCAKTRIDTNKVTTLYIGVDVAAFARHDGSRLVREQLHIPPHRIVVGLVGRIDRAKGIDTLIEAAPTIVRAVPNVLFAIVGGSEAGGGVVYERELHERINALGMASYFVFTGFRDDIPVVMQSLDIVVCASQEEAFGLVVIEAMAAAKPVVAYNRGALPEIVIHNQTGLVVQYTVADLAQGIIALARDEHMRQQYGTAGREVVTKVFSLDTTIDILEKFYGETTE